MGSLGRSSETTVDEAWSDSGLGSDVGEDGGSVEAPEGGIVVGVAGKVVEEGLAVAVVSEGSVTVDDPPQAASTASNAVDTAIQR